MRPFYWLKNVALIGMIIFANTFQSEAQQSINEKIEDLIGQMTIEEKIGQMTQIDITKINTTGKQKDVELDEAKFRAVLKKYHIGSFLNGEAVPPEKWLNYMEAVLRIGREESRLGIPLIYGIDHMHGASYVANSTLFPHNITVSGSFNTEFAYQMGVVTANESAYLGHHWIFAPVLDVARNPLWARFYETFGEDSYLAGEMGAAFVRGVQENGETAPFKQAATGKHFLGYGDPKTGWDRTPAAISDQALREFHVPSFKRAIEAGLLTIMVNSGEINGVPVHASKEILTDLLRNELGFEGVVVTDWGDIDKLVNYHKVAENYKEAVLMAIDAGIDMNMTPTHFRFNDALLELVKEGLVSEERLNVSVRRILKLKFTLGLFDQTKPLQAIPAQAEFEQHAQLALNATRESLVLLKNEKLLPLKNPSTMILVGTSVRDKKNWHGGWTHTWQGSTNERLRSMQSFEDAMKHEFPNTEIIVFDEITSKNEKNFLKQASKADAIFVVAGEEPYTEFVGNIDDLRLPEQQRYWLSTVLKSKKPVGIILVEGRPRLFSEFDERLKSVIFAGLPGTFGPQATAEILSGKVNPSGKLSFSYPRFPNHHQPYNHKPGAVYFFDSDEPNFIQQESNSTQLYHFGDGLSYTRFSYSHLTLSSQELKTGETITAKVTITNTGSLTGKEAVLWFLTDEVGRITRPVKLLKHFEKIELKSGERKEVEFELFPFKHLSYPDSKGNAVVEKGWFTLTVGSEKIRFRLN